MTARKLFYLLSAICFGFVIFAKLGDHQLEIYDEARRAVNALEMYTGQSGFLVPTFTGVPEHWGTKPPTLLWLQVAFMHLVGPGELALRLPSALATSLAILFMVWFSLKQWKEPIIGVLAGWILLSNWNFIGNHGARSGDYDALLMLFCAGQILFFARLVATDKYRYLYLSALSLFLAGWIKGIAACFMLPAIAIYVLATPQGRKYLLDWRMYLSYALALMGILSYYLLREHYDPGYLQLVYENELGGRFTEAKEGHRFPWYHYLHQLVTDKTFGFFGQLLLPAAVVAGLLRKRYVGSLLFVLAIATFLLTISSSATRLYWYLVPTLPLIGLLVGTLLYEIGQHLLTQLKIDSPWLRSGVVLVFMLGLFGWSYGQLFDRVTRSGDFINMQQKMSSYRTVIRGDSIAPPYTVAPIHYHPSIRFYSAIERMKGRDIQFQSIEKLIFPWVSKDTECLKAAIGDRLLICEQEPWDWVSKHYNCQIIKRQEHCSLVKILGYKPGIPSENLPEGITPPAEVAPL